MKAARNSENRKPVGSTISVAILSRPPVPGKTKSRLAAAIGAEPASRFGRMSLEIYAKRLTQFGLPFVLEPIDQKDRDWFATHFSHIALGMEQASGSLGQRMVTAINRQLEQSSIGFVLGSDSPDAPFAALKKIGSEKPVGQKVNTVWIGPSSDGGFWTLGCNRILPDGILDNITWSSGSEYEITVDVFRSAGYEIRELPVGHDVDRLSDLKDLIARCRSQQQRTGKLEGWEEKLADDLEKLIPFRRY